jgi:hypothetical protein
MHPNVDVLLTKTSLAPSECDTGIHVLLTKLAPRERDHKNVRRTPGLIHAPLITLLVVVRVEAVAVRGLSAIPYEQPLRALRAVTERLVLSEICLTFKSKPIDPKSSCKTSIGPLSSREAGALMFSPLARE